MVNLKIFKFSDWCIKQAGAELCRAQVKLRLAKLAVTRKKLRAYKLSQDPHHQQRCLAVGVPAAQDLTNPGLLGTPS